ncbi:hypothetical protein MVEN_01132300 [Mycena venus]|uniref:GPI anchored protein n=1 Tax=Mycena venus TaxID=2733690 RepID=A0A8H7D0Q5_9AGAR|nr:hypothetical protein MVEN_01132300 [Mycena venus]
MKLPLSTVTALSLAVPPISAQTVTLFGLPTPSVPGLSTLVVDHSFTISAIGTNSNGGTTYAEVDIFANSVVVDGSDTTTFLASITFTDTFVEGASGATDFASSGVAVETCGFGADGRGTCVFDLPVPGQTQSSTLSTESGSVIPFYTLTAPTPSPSGPSHSSTAPTPSPSGSSHSGAVLHSPFAVWNALAVALALIRAL